MTDSREIKKMKNMKRLLFPRRVRWERPLTLDASTKRDFSYRRNKEEVRERAYQTRRNYYVSESRGSSSRAVISRSKTQREQRN